MDELPGGRTGRAWSVKGTTGRRRIMNRWERTKGKLK